MSFNIDKIIKECPKAFSEMLKSRDISFKEITSVKWYERTKQFCVITDDQYAHFIYFRDLYDFFDSVGIKISVYFDADDDWCYEILALNSELIIRECWYSYREDVERVAIPKAFEIYEKQLG